MSTSQLLLRRLLEQAGGATGNGYVLVLDGEGLETLPDQMVTPSGAYSVHRVQTELGLRHLLWKSNGAPVIAVLPEPVANRVQNAPDILRRAHKQRVHALLVNDVLEVVLGVRVVGADDRYMQDLALEHMEQLGVALSHRTLPTVVDRKLLTELLVDTCIGTQVRTHTPAQLLAMWIQDPPRWPPNLGQLVRAALPTMHGDEGSLLAWALEQPDEDRLQHLVLYGAVMTVASEQLPKPAWGPFWQAAKEPPLKMDTRILRRILAGLAEATLAELGDQATGLLGMADRLGRESLTPAELMTSRVLPLAFSDRCHALAQQAARGKAISGADIAWLASHRAAVMHRPDLAVLEAMARLSRYLDQPHVPGTGILNQVRDFQRHGAFADLGMLQLRRALGSCADHHAEANQLITACLERRNGENQRFATLLKGGYEAALHEQGLTPLHRLWKRTVAPVWQQDPERRLFLVVLDGCSYPVFIELINQLNQDSTFVLGLRPDGDGRVGGLPALAPLPTITSHARGAIFLGELPSDPLVAETVFRDQDEAKTDRARFNQNKALGDRSRRLFLKGDLADNGQALLEALKDGSLDVVAAVFNAVDDQIGSANTGALVRLAPENIAGFKPALRAAIKANRRILLTADHGHSPYLDNSHRVGAGKSPRYLALGPQEPAPDGFLEIDLAGLGGPPERRAFAWRSGAYLGGPQVGFHGGCSLEEMVVPLAWLERDGLPADEPMWWFGTDLIEPAVAAAKPILPPLVTPAPTDQPKSAAGRHKSLFDPEDRTEALPLPEAVLAKLSSDERIVLVLLQENGCAKASELSDRLAKNPGRLNGLMRTLRRRLYEDGIVLFVDEVLPTGETMYRYQAKEIV